MYTWKTFQKHAVLLDHLGRGALSVATEKQAEEFICRVYSPCTNIQPLPKCVTDFFRRSKKTSTYPELSFQTHPTCPLPEPYLVFGNTSPDHTSPFNNGWNKDPTSGQLHPQLMVEDPLPQKFSDIVYYKYKNCATARCTCRSKQLKCTGACSCSDDIYRNPFTMKNKLHVSF